MTALAMYVAGSRRISFTVLAPDWEAAAELGAAMLEDLASRILLAGASQALRLETLQRVDLPPEAPMDARWVAGRCVCCERYQLAGEDDYVDLDGGGVLCRACDEELSR